MIDCVWSFLSANLQRKHTKREDNFWKMHTWLHVSLVIGISTLRIARYFVLCGFTELVYWCILSKRTWCPVVWLDWSKEPLEYVRRECFTTCGKKDFPNHLSHRARRFRIKLSTLEHPRNEFEDKNVLSSSVGHSSGWHATDVQKHIQNLRVLLPQQGERADQSHVIIRVRARIKKFWHEIGFVWNCGRIVIRILE